MELKEYQRRVVDEVEGYLARVAALRAEGGGRHASLDAWRDLGLPGRYVERENGLGEDLPTVCVKVPTGGGKTVLATQFLGSAHRTILRERNGAGLVLWVVPSGQIYRDTLRRLRDRTDWYRIMLEHAVSRRLEIWEKHEIARLTPGRLRDCLNILVLQLASTNRETNEQLKFFRDSGGNIVRHFPPEDDAAGHRALREAFPNLDMIEDDERSDRCLVKTSIGNLVRLCRPAVILDEGHRATSALARKTIEGFNASLVVELSATPQKDANVVSRVSGEELLDEEMIKLPLNIATSGQKNWKDVLTQARDKREGLRELADNHAAKVGPERLIRPIVLVQVERTGKDQREAGHIHSEDVKAYLMQRLGIGEKAIAIKTSQTDDIEGIDLMDPECPVEWIITKAALQEGWDCPFAYILVSLDNTGSGRAMTQLVGRVLRQPYQERTPQEALNESYVFCLRRRAGDLAKDVKKALEREGYEGDFTTVVDASRGEAKKPEREVVIRPEFRKLYTKPFKGKIYLPHFCIKVGNEVEPLDYYRHLIGRVDVDAFDYRFDWPLEQAVREAKDRFLRIGLGDDVLRTHETVADLLESDDEVKAWMAASLPFAWLSHKQLRRIIERVYERLCECELSCMVRGKLGLVKFVVREKIERLVAEEVDKQTERVFGELFKKKKLMFYLECKECRFEIPESVKVQPTRRLEHDDGEPIAKSLFDYVDHEGANEYERAVALCLDRNADVLWWYRNLVGDKHFSIQGYRKNRIRPDFVVQNGSDDRPTHRVLVIESKGAHLEGNPDTKYKRQVASYFSEVGKRVPWTQLGQDFKDHTFRFQILDESQELGRDWRDELRDVLASD